MSQWAIATRWNQRGATSSALGGAGLFVFFARGARPRRRSRRGCPGGQAVRPISTPICKIGADGRVTCFAGKVELGQGAHDRAGAGCWPKSWTSPSTPWTW